MYRWIFPPLASFTKQREVVVVDGEAAGRISKLTRSSVIVTVRYNHTSGENPDALFPRK